MSAKPTPGELWKISEIARRAKVSDKTIRRLIDQRTIAVTRIGSAVRISEAAYNDWVRRSTEEVQL